MPTQNARVQSQPPNRAFVYIAAIFAALGGLLFGYDTGVISGAELFLKNDFTLTTFALEVIVSGVLAGAAAGALLGGRMADLFGRRRLLIVTAIIFGLGGLACAAATSTTILIVGRIVVGLGIGLSSGTVPVYISEVSPADARGWQVSLFQLAITVGILLAYVVDYAFAAIQGWRWMFGLAVVPAAIFGLGLVFLPESPRGLAEHGQIERARAMLARIRGTSDVDIEMREIVEGIERGQGPRGRLSDLFAPSLRPALIVGIGLAVFQQVTGINTVIYYAPLIIQSSGISSASGAILATAGIGVVNVLMTIVAMWLIDRVGRRPLLLVGIAGMVVTLGLLGFAFQMSTGGALAWLAVVTLMVYVASFAISLGPIFWLIIAEIYPLRVRGIAEGTAAGVNWASNFVVSFTFLTLIEVLGPSMTFWVYALLAVASWLFAYYLVPETKGRTLEEIEHSFRPRHAA